MDERIRGYLLKACHRYLRVTLSSDESDRVLTALPDDVPRDAESFEDVEWYPVRYVSAYCEALATLDGGDQTRAYDRLQAYGRFAERTAPNTFKAPVSNVTTPAGFAMKCPDLWMRDHRFGRMVPDVSDLASRHIVFRLSGVACFTHLGPVAAGFGASALSSMGMGAVEVRQEGWSLSTPAPDTLVYDVTWHRASTKSNEPGLDIIPIGARWG